MNPNEFNQNPSTIMGGYPTMINTPGVNPGYPPQQQYQEPVKQVPVAQSNDSLCTFVMDQDVYRILNAIPEIYRNFIINFGIKLAAEQNIYQSYLTNFFPADEIVVSEQVSMQQPVVPQQSTTIPKPNTLQNGSSLSNSGGINNGKPQNAATPTPSIAPALDGFKSW